MSGEMNSGATNAEPWVLVINENQIGGYYIIDIGDRRTFMDGVR